MNNVPSDSTSPGFTIFEQVCKSDPHRRGLISDLYAQLLSHISSSPPTYINKWERDLQLQPENINWTQIWQATKSASPNIVALETNYKVLTRWYLVPARSSKFSSQYTSHCFRGCPFLGTQVHIWWECKIVRFFWSEVFKILSNIFKITLPPNPTTALLNSKQHALSHRQFKLMLFVTTAVKQTIANAWKSDSLYILSDKNRVTQSMIHAKTNFLDNVLKPCGTHGLNISYLRDSIIHCYFPEHI